MAADHKPHESSPLLPQNTPSPQNPLPRRQLLLLCSARLVQPIAFFCIFSYVTRMVQDITHAAPADAGIYAGVIESLFSLAQLCVMVLWARLSDRVGRKPVLVISLAAVSLASALFGFSTSVGQMIIYRCLAGVFAGSVVTIRTMIAEIATTKESQGVAFSWFAVAGNLGIFVGPFVGGVLADPVNQYPGVFPRLAMFLEYPYALPGLATCALGLGSAVIMAMFLRETFSPSLRKTTNTATDTTESAPLTTSPPKMSTLQLLTHPGIPPLLASTAAMTLLAFGYTAIVPVFLFTPIHLGGFGFGPLGISTFMGIQGLSQTLWLFFAFPRIHKRLGTRRCLRVLSRVSPYIFIPIPVLNILLRGAGAAPATPNAPFPSPSSESGTGLVIMALFWIILALELLLMPGLAMGFVASQLSIAQAAPSPRMLATLNALALMLTSGMRSVVPVVATAAYAGSIKAGWGYGHTFWGGMVVLGWVFQWATGFLAEENDEGNEGEGDKETGVKGRA